MSKVFRNVHIYDGHLKGIYTDEHKYSNSEKRELIESFAKILSKQPALKMLALILKDINNGSNYDSSNDIDASDVLATILTHKVMTKDIVKLLEEQLVDTFSLGQCPQGRSTRMIQIYNIIKDC